MGFATRVHSHQKQKSMKLKRRFAVLLCLCLGAWCSFAQTNVGPTVTDGSRVGKVVMPDTPLASDAITTVARPKVPERQDLSPEVQDKIQKFKRDAQAYLDRQQALKKQLVGANDQERARIREQLEALRLKWLERSRELREEFRDRAAELRDKLRDHGPVIDSAQDAVRSPHSNRGR